MMFSHPVSDSITLQASLKIVIWKLLLQVITTCIPLILRKKGQFPESILVRI